MAVFSLMIMGTKGCMCFDVYQHVSSGGFHSNESLGEA